MTVKKKILSTIETFDAILYNAIRSRGDQGRRRKNVFVHRLACFAGVIAEDMIVIGIDRVAADDGVAVGSDDSFVFVVVVRIVVVVVAVRFIFVFIVIVVFQLFPVTQRLETDFVFAAEMLRLQWRLGRTHGEAPQRTAAVNQGWIDQRRRHRELVGR